MMEYAVLHADMAPSDLSDTYNQGLSERRAEAVKRFLAEKYGIDASNLVTVGYGKTQLKNPAGPFASENRRVQVINASDK